jgi:hypothetical protein
MQCFSTFLICGTLFDSKKFGSTLNLIKMTIQGSYINKMLKFQFLAAPQTPLDGTLMCLGTPVENYCLNVSDNVTISVLDKKNHFNSKKKHIAQAKLQAFVGVSTLVLCPSIPPLPLRRWSQNEAANYRPILNLKCSLINWITVNMISNSLSS